MTLVLTGPPQGWKAQLEAADLQNVKRGAEFVSLTGVAATRLGTGDWFYAVDTTAASVTVTLPDVADAAGRHHVVKRTSGGANACKIVSAGGLLDGSATHSIAAQYGVRCYFADGSAWRSIGALGGAAGEVAAGIYTPTLTGIANIDGTGAYPAHYMRVRDVVTVAGRLDVDATAGGTTTRVGISLPIASDFSALEDASGTAQVRNIGLSGGNQPGAIYADAANNRAELEFVSGATFAAGFQFHFTYRIR